MWEGCWDISRFLCLKENHSHRFSLWNCSVPMGRGRFKSRVFPPQQSANKPISALYSGIICLLHIIICVSTNSQIVAKFNYFLEKSPKVSLLDTNAWHLQGSGTITFFFFPTLLLCIQTLIYFTTTFIVHHQAFKVCDLWGHLLQFDSPANKKDMALFSDQSSLCPLLFPLWLMCSLWCCSGTRYKHLHLPTSHCRSLSVFSHFHQGNYLCQRAPDSTSQLSCPRFWTQWTRWWLVLIQAYLVKSHGGY